MVASPEKQIPINLLMATTTDTHNFYRLSVHQSPRRRRRLLSRPQQRSVGVSPAGWHYYQWPRVRTCSIIIRTDGQSTPSPCSICTQQRHPRRPDIFVSYLALYISRPHTHTHTH